MFFSWMLLSNYLKIYLWCMCVCVISIVHHTYSICASLFLCDLALHHKTIICHFLLPLSAQFRQSKSVVPMTRSVSCLVFLVLTFQSFNTLKPEQSFSQEKATPLCLVSFKGILRLGEHDLASAWTSSPSHTCSPLLYVLVTLPT